MANIRKILATIMLGSEYTLWFVHCFFLFFGGAGLLALFLTGRWAAIAIVFYCIILLLVETILTLQAHRLQRTERRLSAVETDHDWASAEQFRTALHEISTKLEAAHE